MAEIITQTRIEDAIDVANTFLYAERGAAIDGSFAGRHIAERVATVQERAEAILQAEPHPKQPGFYVPLSKRNVHMYAEAAAVLPGYVVLVPSVLVAHGTASFYPAVVSEDGLKTDSLRLHVLCQPYRQYLGYGASMVLSAAGQSETKGVGEHGRQPNDGVEAEHFATLLAAGSDTRVQSAWQSGLHVNHAWRLQPSNSVTSEVSRRLFGREIPQATITVTQQQIADGQAMLLWHEGMRDAQTGSIETATRDKALVTVQALGYAAVQARNPERIDVLKRLIA